jgi:hypothetical protein
MVGGDGNSPEAHSRFYIGVRGGEENGNQQGTA